MLTWEGTPIQGVNAIVEKLTVPVLSTITRSMTDRPKKNNLVASFHHGATQSNDARRAAILPVLTIAHRERHRLARGKSKKGLFRVLSRT